MKELTFDEQEHEMRTRLDWKGWPFPWDRLRRVPAQQVVDEGNGILAINWVLTTATDTLAHCELHDVPMTPFQALKAANGMVGGMVRFGDLSARCGNVRYHATFLTREGQGHRMDEAMRERADPLPVPDAA